VFRRGYRRRAFSVQYNVILLFGAGAFAAASASWLPLAAGGVAELSWLVAAPFFPSFRRWADSRRGDDLLLAPVQPAPMPARAAAPAPPAVSAGPSPPVAAAYGERAKKLAVSLREISVLAEEQLAGDRDEALASALPTLTELSAAFERLCKLHERLSLFVAQTSKLDLEQDAARLADAFSMEKDLGLRTTLRQALVLAQRRLEQHGRICSLQRATELRLDMIVGAAAHVRAQGLTAASPQRLAAEIRGLSTHVAQIDALEHDSADAPASRRGSAQPSHSGVPAGDV
jgi:hypothetical protein